MRRQLAIRSRFHIPTKFNARCAYKRITRYISSMRLLLLLLLLSFIFFTIIQIHGIIVIQKLFTTRDVLFSITKPFMMQVDFTCQIFRCTHMVLVVLTLPLSYLLHNLLCLHQSFLFGNYILSVCYISWYKIWRTLYIIRLRR